MMYGLNDHSRVSSQGSIDGRARRGAGGGGGGGGGRAEHFESHAYHFVAI